MTPLVDSSTSSLTAVVAIYVADLCDVAIRNLKETDSLTRTRVPRNISNHIKAKYNLFVAVAQFHTGPSTSSDRAVAERLARLDTGKKFIAASIGYAQEVGGYLVDAVMVSRLPQIYQKLTLSLPIYSIMLIILSLLIFA